MRSPAGVAVVAGLLSLLAPAQGLAQGASASPPGIELREIGRFEFPVYAAQAPEQPGTVYVVEQAGRVIAVRGGRPEPKPFLDIRDRVSFGPGEASSYEAGLLSLAFDPRYAENGRFYVFYTDRAGDNRVVGFRRSGRKRFRAERDSARTALKIPHPYGDTHNGGQLQFGPDGHLWVSTGDGRCCGDELDQARSLGTLLGKLLRIKPRAVRRGHRVARSNPLVGLPGRDPIYAWGLRNPWRFSFDRLTGMLALSDVGDEAPSEEEVNLLSPAAARGANFGWPAYEGFSENDPARPAGGNLVSPVHSYRQGAGTCAITGGYVVRDPGLPSLWGRYVYADFCKGRIRSFAQPGLFETRAGDDRDEGLWLRYPSSFGEGLDGRIYVTSRAGPVYRLRAAG